MNKTFILDLINPDLTPKNATQRGYKYVEDVIDPYEAVKEIIELAAQKGYTFGSPTEKGNKFRVGLYKKEK